MLFTHSAGRSSDTDRESSDNARATPDAAAHQTSNAGNTRLRRLPTDAVRVDETDVRDVFEQQHRTRDIQSTLVITIRGSRYHSSKNNDFM